MGKLIKATLLTGAALLVTSCEIYPNGYTSVSYSTNEYSSSVSWTAASYDANGFPIYGYSYGRPVYGYTVSGAPIFSINLLYAGCYVPSWKPAPWCTHHHHYPTGCHHAARPPKYDHGHKPHVRPSMHAPIHQSPRHRCEPPEQQYLHASGGAPERQQPRFPSESFIIAGLE